MGYAFISYSSKQQKEADRLKLMLHENGIRTWMAPDDIPDDRDYADVINDAIQNAACFVLLLTRDAQASTYVDKEVERALHYGKTIAPIQLDNAILNDSFSFYLCNQQIVAVSDLDRASPETERLLQHLQLLCNGPLPEKNTPKASSGDKRIRRLKIARLFMLFGGILWIISLLCGQKYIWYSARGTWGEMYGTKPIPTQSEIIRVYVLFFCMASVAVSVFLYGYGLRDPKKKTWNPFRVFPKHLLLPAFSVLCGSGSAILDFLQSAVAGILLSCPIEAYGLPQWVMPITRILSIVCIATALLSLVLAILRSRRKGFPFAKLLCNKFQSIATRRKRGDR